MIICLPEHQIIKQTISYAQLAEQHYICDGVEEGMGKNCNASIHRYCSTQFQSTGFGPLERTASEAQIACVPQAEVFETSYTEMSQLHDGCSGNGQRAGPNCNAAIHRYCSARSFRSGWGPLENSGDTLYLACIY